MVLLTLNCQKKNPESTFEIALKFDFEIAKFVQERSTNLLRYFLTMTATFPVISSWNLSTMEEPLVLVLIVLRPCWKFKKDQDLAPSPVDCLGEYRVTGAVLLVLLATVPVLPWKQTLHVNTDRNRIKYSKCMSFPYFIFRIWRPMSISAISIPSPLALGLILPDNHLSPLTQIY